MNLDNPCLCPHCSYPMQVLMPIWVTPGESSIDTGEIDWESGNKQWSNNWYCSTCESHHFPLDNERGDDAGQTVQCPPATSG